jgi:hypothetical protein
VVEEETIADIWFSLVEHHVVPACGLDAAYFQFGMSGPLPFHCRLADLGVTANCNLKLSIRVLGGVDRDCDPLDWGSDEEEVEDSLADANLGETDPALPCMKFVVLICLVAIIIFGI